MISEQFGGKCRGAFLGLREVQVLCSSTVEMKAQLVDLQPWKLRSSFQLVGEGVCDHLGRNQGMLHFEAASVPC